MKPCSFTMLHQRPMPYTGIVAVRAAAAGVAGRSMS
jgi:hypothetical protein